MEQNNQILQLRNEIFSLARQIRLPVGTLWRHTHSDDEATPEETIKAAFALAQVNDKMRDKILCNQSLSYSDEEIQAAVEVIETLRKWRDEDRANGLIDW